MCFFFKLFWILLEQSGIQTLKKGKNPLTDQRWNSYQNHGFIQYLWLLSNICGFCQISDWSLITLAGIRHLKTMVTRPQPRLRVVGHGYVMAAVTKCQLRTSVKKILSYSFIYFKKTHTISNKNHFSVLKLSVCELLKSLYYDLW